MRTEALLIALLAAGAVTPARSEPRVADSPARRSRPAPILVARFVPPERAQEYGGGRHLHLTRISSIRSVAGGVDASPFVTALPGEMWHGRRRSFGTTDGGGFSGIAVRARSVGFGGLQPEGHVSGFLATELRYGIPLDHDDLLTADFSAAWQRIPARQATGLGASVHAGSVYLGAALVHAHRLSFTGGWYRLRVSTLSPLDYAVERSAGMPPSGQGFRLGCDWRLGPAAATAPARISLDYRDGDADRDRFLSLGSGSGRERRMLLRFTAPF